MTNRKDSKTAKKREVLKAGRRWTALAMAMFAPLAQGASIAYLNGSGVTDLSDGAAWDGGIAPGVGDVAVFDGSIPDTLAVPAAGVAWSGIVRTNIVNAVTFEGGPLAIGADGIACFTENADYHRTYLQDVVLAAAQTWTLATNKALYVLGSVTGTGPLSLAADGAYNAVFCGEVEPTGGVVAQSALNVWAVQGSRFAQAPAMAPGAQFLFLPDGTGEVAFRDVVSSGAFANEGIFSFGSYDGATGNAAAVSPVVTLSAGDSIKGSSTSNSSRDKQVVRVQDTHVVNDGADVTLNSWFYIRSGSWTQLAGDTAFNYAVIVGRGETADYKCKRQCLTLAGGTFKARRMSVGVANAETCPAEVFVTGGSYESTMPNGENWAAALAIGQRVASGETYWDAKKQEDVNLDSQWASGRFEMTGGTVTTPTVFFGNDYDIDGKKDVNTAARLALRGGTLRLGVNGIRPAAYWNANSNSRYDCVLSGGTFTFYKSFADSKADMRLSDRDGGTSFYSTNGITDTRISGTLYGPGRFRKTGPSTLRLTGSNDYTGRTDVVEGFLYTGSDCANPFIAVWQADDFCGLGAGASAGNWANRAGSGTWTFQNAGAINTFSGMGLSMPTVAATTMNGHAELVFDGTRAMFITGNAAQPFSEKTEFTVTCALRVEEGAVGGGSDSWHDSTVVMGCTNPGDSPNIRYGLTLNSDGCLGCGMQIKLTDGGTTNETLWSDTPINDGKPHVVVWTWKLKGKHFLQVDDKSWSRSSVSNGDGVIIKTRLILGANEYAPANTFRGTIADLRMARSQFSAEARVACARALGLRYGVEAFAAAPEPSAPSEETVPAATATWTTESLAQSDGEAVSEWPEKDGKGATSSSTWTFTATLADTILKTTKSGYAGSTASPVIARGPDGHKLVSFNGANACLALTGGNDTPVSGAGAITVAAVVRFTGYGSSGGSFTPKGSATGFFGESFSSANRQWLFALSGSARVAAFAEWNNQAGTVALRSARRFLDDGELHVLVASYPPHGAEGTMRFALDGMMTDAVCTPAKAIGKTRILLGAAEQNSVARYAPVDVAEFRFWKNVALTPGQMETLTRELCAKYNVYAEGYERGIAADGRQRSREVFVHAGASYGAPVGYDFTLWPDQTIWGDGNVVGHMYVSPGAAVKVTATNTLSAADVEFADGAILKAECAANGAVNALPVTGDLWLPDGTVTVDVSGGEPPPQTTLLTWTGKVRQRGTAEFVPSDPNSRLAFRLDETNRRLVVASSAGTVISIR